MEKRPLILVVDDEEPIRKLLLANLSITGFDVVTAADGVSALAVQAEQKPDLIILDIMMPELDGLQVLSRIRQRSSVPVIMLTARDGLACLKHALNDGADDYITKPFSIVELLARVRAKLRRITSSSTARCD